MAGSITVPTGGSLAEYQAEPSLNQFQKHLLHNFPFTNEGLVFEFVTQMSFP
jgi:hypothetical protein